MAGRVWGGVRRGKSNRTKHSVDSKSRLGNLHNARIHSLCASFSLSFLTHTHTYTHTYTCAPVQILSRCGMYAELAALYKYGGRHVEGMELLRRLSQEPEGLEHTVRGAAAGEGGARWRWGGRGGLWISAQAKRCQAKLAERRQRRQLQWVGERVLRRGEGWERGDGRRGGRGPMGPRNRRTWGSGTRPHRHASPPPTHTPGDRHAPAMPLRLATTLLLHTRALPPCVPGYAFSS